jgi:hypothetical protein
VFQRLRSQVDADCCRPFGQGFDQGVVHAPLLTEPRAPVNPLRMIILFPSCRKSMDILHEGDRCFLSFPKTHYLSYLLSVKIPQTQFPAF